MKIIISLITFLATSSLYAQVERPSDTWTWMIAGNQRLVVNCHSRGVVKINSFDSELAIIKRTTGDMGCKKFDVLHIQNADNDSWLKNIHINATVYGLDRLKRSPSTLIRLSLLDRIIYPIKLLGVRTQTKRLGKKLTRFLEDGEFPRTEQVSKDYFELFVEQSQIAHEDYLTLSR